MSERDPTDPSAPPAPAAKAPRLNERLIDLDLECEGCGYNLRGVVGPFCPECGLVIPMPDVPDSTPAERLRDYLSTHDIACKHCGYNLRGLQDNACPECGATYQLSLGITYGVRHKPEALTDSKAMWRRWWRIHAALVLVAALISTGLAIRGVSASFTPTLIGIIRAVAPSAVAVAIAAAWWLARPALIEQPARMIRGVGVGGVLFGTLGVIVASAL